MHPVIRIVTFLVFGIFLAFGDARHVGLGLALLTLFYLSGQYHLLSSNWRMLKRMRWLFLSILVVYLWFTPGQRIFQSLGAWSPTWQGLLTGGLRVGSLILIVMAVNALIKSVSQERMTGALMWLLAPLRYVGLPQERLALRVSMTFSLIGETQYVHDLMKRSSVQQPLQEKAPSLSQRLDKIGQYAADILQAVLDKAAQSPLNSIQLPQENNPPVWQWSFPIILCGVFIIVPRILA
jgi:energy-coupling factor transport system permease protein